VVHAGHVEHIKDVQRQRVVAAAGEVDTFDRFDARLAAGVLAPWLAMVVRSRARPLPARVIVSMPVPPSMRASWPAVTPAASAAMLLALRTKLSFAGAAVEDVGAAVADQRVVAGVADQRFGCGAAGEGVVAGAAELVDGAGAKAPLVLPKMT
jgi:hypothetical protein